MSQQSYKNIHKFSKEIADLVENENAMAATVFDILLRKVQEDSCQRPLYQSIAAIYFIDYLKFFTGIGYRKRQCDLLGVTLPEDDYKISTQWPYLLMNEIKFGYELDQFRWGHHFTNLPNYKRKKLMTKLLILSNFCLGGAKANVAITEEAFTSKRAKLAFRHRINLDMVSIKNFDKTPIVDLALQLNDLDKMIEDILDVTTYPFDLNTAKTMLRHHIEANCIDGVPPRPSSSDILIAGSGCAIENRLMSSMARYHGMRVINIFHGGSYGVQNKPTFSQGEKLMATDLAVFGQVKGLSIDNVKFINGNYEKINPLGKDHKITTPKHNDKIMYVPTSLRGENKRFGPYEDMSDNNYIRVWGMMRQIFGDDLIIKLHPKNSNSADIAQPIMTENFEYCLNHADTFIFDYVSTAFTLAAATNRPIVFLDYGLQNFTKDGINAIKSRCIYYDMRLAQPSSFDDIIKKAKSMSFDYDYIHQFVSEHGQKTIDEEMFLAILSS